MYWALVIVLLAGTDGGRAVNTDLKFTSRERCEQARDIFNSTKWNGSWVPSSACVPVDFK